MMYKYNGLEGGMGILYHSNNDYIYCNIYRKEDKEKSGRHHIFIEFFDNGTLLSSATYIYKYIIVLSQMRRLNLTDCEESSG